MSKRRGEEALVGSRLGISRKMVATTNKLSSTSTMALDLKKLNSQVSNVDKTFDRLSLGQSAMTVAKNH